MDRAQLRRGLGPSLRHKARVIYDRLYVWHLFFPIRLVGWGVLAAILALIDIRAALLGPIVFELSIILLGRLEWRRTEWERVLSFVSLLSSAEYEMGDWESEIKTFRRAAIERACAESPPGPERDLLEVVLRARSGPG